MKTIMTSNSRTVLKDLFNDDSCSFTQILSQQELGNEEKEATNARQYGVNSKPLLASCQRRKRSVETTTKRDSGKPKRMPPFSYSKLIQDVLLEHGKLTVKELFQKLAEKYPESFTMKEKKWQASVRSCLTNKDHFVKDNSHVKGSYWKLSGSVLAKLKSTYYDSESQFKENIPVDRGSWNTGKYTTIAPKPRFHNENSFDGIHSLPSWNTKATVVTPSKPVSPDSVRLCYSEDKNLFRKRKLSLIDSNLTMKRAHGNQPEFDSLKNRTLSKRHSLPNAKTRTRLITKLESQDSFHFQITNKESSTLSSVFRPLDEIAFNETDNASFNVKCDTLELGKDMPTSFKGHPGLNRGNSSPISMPKVSLNAGCIDSANRKDLIGTGNPIFESSEAAAIEVPTPVLFNSQVCSDEDGPTVKPLAMSPISENDDTLAREEVFAALSNDSFGAFELQQLPHDYDFSTLDDFEEFE